MTTEMDYMAAYWWATMACLVRAKKPTAADLGLRRALLRGLLRRIELRGAYA